MTQDNGTKNPILPGGLSIADLSHIPLIAVLMLIIIVGYFQMMSLQNDYRTLVVECRAPLAQTAPPPPPTPRAFVTAPPTGS